VLDLVIRLRVMGRAVLVNRVDFHTKTLEEEEGVVVLERAAISTMVIVVMVCSPESVFRVSIGASVSHPES